MDEGSDNLAEAINYVEANHPLPRCKHDAALRDGAGEALEPPCGCHASAPTKQGEGSEVVELKPCPFCGSAAEYDDPMLPERSLVGCSNSRCITRSPIRGGREVWNTRPDGVARDAVCKELAEGLFSTKYMELRDGSPCWCKDGLADRCTTEWTYRFEPNSTMVHCRACTQARAALTAYRKVKGD